MTSNTKSNLRLILTASLVLLLSGVASYSFARSKPRTAPSPSDSLKTTSMFPSGTYLVAYIVTASDCGFCTEKYARKAIGEFRDSLVKANSGKFAAVRVIGVALDDNVDNGVTYLRGIRSGFPSAFDQIVVGGSWLNEFFSASTWRDRFGTPDVPQVLIFKRHVDARAYPREIIVSPDTLVFKFAGRDSLLAFVNGGGKLPTK